MSWFAGIGGIASAIGGYINNQDSIAASKQLLKMSQKFNHEEAVINRDWQKDMSNTQYQRGMADMMKAGLNPMLASTNGGAGTPSGAQASASGTPPSLKNWIGEGVASALQVYQGLSSVKLQEQETAKKEAETELVQAQTQSIPLQNQLTETQERELAARILGPGQAQDLKREEIQQVIAQAQASRAAAGASSAQANLSNAQEFHTRLRADYLDRNQAEAPAAQGYNVPGAGRLPAPSQVGRDLDRLSNRMVQQPGTGRQVEQLNQLQNGAIIDIVGNATRARHRANTGNDPTPNPAYQNREDNQ